ncbi:hypothetical protein ISF_08679 [Cordyceps fumosorosea ARSEF 2679]|uniref:Uncharacterized protein n=1 Tax=Cordyceps fumosorosea (strain ARSEF 2679) TaxID=1081104 RepID=A0A162MBC9_CORFA|nr:hypothetical protein ISF_08679 [Cordyceps fumosorosea ARSEF 2679]OAA53740.1 hypothetical protein ISF_08679 [Cordyceps fumosorosea ARSEF 2679]
MAGVVFQTYRPAPPRGPDLVVAGPSSQRQSPTQQIELQPMMTPAAYPPPPPASRRQPPPPPPPPPSLSHDLVMERALPRASHRYGLSQAIARSVSMSLALAGLASALYLAARWRIKRGVAGVAIGANAVAILIDAFMLIDLINTNLPRVSPYAIGGLDLVMMAAALTAGLFVELSDEGYEDDPAPWRHVMVVTAGLTWATAGVRLVYVIWSILDCRRVRKTRQDMQRNYV